MSEGIANVNGFIEYLERTAWDGTIRDSKPGGGKNFPSL
jgi:hypothetical protein